MWDCEILEFWILAQKKAEDCTDMTVPTTPDFSVWRICETAIPWAFHSSLPHTLPKNSLTINLFTIIKDRPPYISSLWLTSFSPFSKSPPLRPTGSTRERKTWKNIVHALPIQTTVDFTRFKARFYCYTTRAQPGWFAAGEGGGFPLSRWWTRDTTPWNPVLFSPSSSFFFSFVVLWPYFSKY